MDDINTDVYFNDFKVFKPFHSELHVVVGLTSKYTVHIELYAFSFTVRLQLLSLQFGCLKIKSFSLLFSELM